MIAKERWRESRGGGGGERMGERVRKGGRRKRKKERDRVERELRERERSLN